MQNDKGHHEVAAEWVSKAENDLKNAAHTLTLKADCPTDTVCFHAQQAVEKYLKAVLVFNGIDFPKTHDIEELISLIPKKFQLDLSAPEQGLLTDYATTTRYPGDYEDIPLSEARKAVVVARRIRKKIRELLPKEVLRNVIKR